MKRRQVNFIKMVHERAAKMQNSWVPFLHNDLMFKILLLLPIKSLLRFTCVCKSWYKLIRCAEFVEAYNTHAKTTPILFRPVDKQRPNTFHVETQLQESDYFYYYPSNSYYRQSKFIHTLNIQNGKGNIVDLNISSNGSVWASCNGLILIVSMHEMHTTYGGLGLRTLIRPVRNPRLIVMNPMTRKLIGFSPGTLSYDCWMESYGLMYSHLTGDYKVVHLFLDKERNASCEILSTRTRTWKAIDGTPVELSSSLWLSPSSGTGALHWVPVSYIDYIISMGVDDEKFNFINLPKAMGMQDRLVEIGGSLSFVNCLGMYHIEVWILKGLKGSEWVKQHTLNIDAAVLGHVKFQDYLLPCFALNAKQMVFRRGDELYLYDFELEVIKEIEMGSHGGKIKPYEDILPHSNSLATWETLESIR